MAIQLMSIYVHHEKYRKNFKKTNKKHQYERQCFINVLDWFFCRHITEIAFQSNFDFASAKNGFLHERVKIDLNMNTEDDQSDEN